jgi:hypothetical protein
MQSSVSIAPITADTIVVNELPSQKPTTLLLRTNRPYLYNSWTLNNRLRLKNEKLTKRQQSSCRIAFYSFWLCVTAGIMIIIIYRFTDECSLATNQKQFLIKCFRHWLYLAAICTSLLAFSGVILGACQYFRSQTLNFLYDDEHQQHLINTNGLLPMTMTSYSHCYPTLLTNVNSIISSRQIQNRDDEHSNIILISSLTNTSLGRKIPPFNYDELPLETTPIIISKSPNMDDNNNTNKILFFSSSTSNLSSPQSMLSTARSSNASNTITNSKAPSILENTCTSTPATHITCISGVDVCKKQ